LNFFPTKDGEMITDPPKPKLTTFQWMKRIEMDPWVTITQCPDKSMWYSQMVGLQVLIEKVTADGLWSREPAGYINIIKFEDAE
jgi:hypothetical protein